MYLVGTAMLIFGTGLHVMFVGTNFKGKGSTVLPESNFFGLFHLQVYHAISTFLFFFANSLSTDYRML